MRFWESTAFRIWVIFGSIGLLVSIPLSYYFNSQQREILQSYSKNEFDVNAAIASSIIEEAIINEDFDLLDQFVENIANHSDFLYIAIIENDYVFSCYPDEFSQEAKVKNDKYIYSESDFESELISGKIVITTSKEKNELMLEKINEPFIYLIVISILSSIVLFALSLRFLSKPIFGAISIAKELGNQNYKVDINLIKGNSEISVLNNSLYALKHKLILLKQENDSYKKDLEKKIKEITREIELKNEELSKLNKNLEQKVLEKTKANIEMSNSLISQEKLVLLGEISSGIAHDLNTPLGSINASNSALKQLLQSINLNSKNLTDKELKLIDILLVKDNLPDPFQKNRIIREESQKINEYLTLKEIANCNDLAKKIASLGVSSGNKELIDQIVQIKNPFDFLDLLKNYLIAFKFINGIGEAVEKSTKVVSSLNSYIRQDINREKKLINLKDSIEVLDTLFKFRLKNNVSFNSSINDDHQVFGIETDLFQVWTNLFKNALDAFDDNNHKTDRQKQIKVYSEKVDNEVLIHFENNGPKIPDNLKDKIMKKYFTTKQNKGTGLGLSLVSKIVSEHYGTFTFTSTDQSTIFTIKLPSTK